MQELTPAFYLFMIPLSPKLLVFDISYDHSLPSKTPPPDRKVFHLFKEKMLKVVKSEAVLNTGNTKKAEYPTDRDKGKILRTVVDDDFKLGMIIHGAEVKFTEKESSLLRHLASLFQKRLCSETHYFEVVIPIRESERESYFYCADTLFYIALKNSCLIEAFYYALLMKQIQPENDLSRLSFARICFILFRLSQINRFGELCEEEIRKFSEVRVKRLGDDLLSKLYIYQAKYSEGIVLLHKLVKEDPKDFKSFTLLEKTLLLFDHNNVDKVELRKAIFEYLIIHLQQPENNTPANQEVCVRINEKIELCTVMKEFAEGKYVSVAARTKKYLKKNEHDLWFLYYQVRALMRSNQKEEAAKLVKKYRDSSLIQGVYQLENKDYKKAYAHYESYFRVLNLEIEDVPLRTVYDLIDIWNSGICHENNNHSLVMHIVSRGLMIDMHSEDFMVVLSEVACYNNAISIAEKVIRSLCEKHPESAFYYLKKLAYRFYHSKMLPECKIVLYEMMDLLWNSPEVSPNCYELNDMLKTFGHTRLSLQFFVEYFRKKPSETVFIILATLFTIEMMIDELYVLSSTYIINNPSACVGHCYFGVALEKKGSFEEALEAASRGLGGTHDIVAYGVSIRSHFALHNYAKVIESFETVYKTTSENVQFLLADVSLYYIQALALTGHHKKANAIFSKFKKYMDEHAILVTRDFLKVLAPTKEEANVQPPPALGIVETKSAAPIEPLKVKETEKPTEAIVQTESEALRKKAPVAVKKHVQPIKGDVVNLSQNAKIEAWKNNPKNIPPCTLDLEVYGREAKARSKKEKKLPALAEILQPLTNAELRRLDIARLSLVRVGDLLKQKKELGNYLFLYPRAIAYNLLKFSEALLPTSYNRSEITELFLNALQTHVISKKILSNLRDSLRHHYYELNSDTLNHFTHQLDESTVLENLKAYQNLKEHVVQFQSRTPLPKKQQFVNNSPIDYVEMVKMELQEMGAIVNKGVSLHDIEANALFKEGLKMAICNIEECIRRLELPEDKLKTIIYFGNKIAHQKAFEEISLSQFGLILGKVDQIRNDIMEGLKTKS